MLQQKFALHLGASLSEKPFTLDELIISTEKLFKEEGMAGFLHVLLGVLDDWACVRWAGSIAPGQESCCKAPKFEAVNREEKRILSMVGKLTIPWTRLRCKNCRKSFIPLRNYLSVKPYQKKTSELEKVVMDVVTEQSYRRTSAHIETIGSIPIPHTTLHRWVMKSDCDEIPMKAKVQTIIADGTGYKKIPEEGSNRGEVKVVVGVTKEGQVIPYGAWTDESWRSIGNKIKDANHPHEKIKFNPIADLLVSDGEEGLIRGLKKLTKEQQRCHWHISHDLYQSMRVDDKAPLEETRKTQSKLAGMIEVRLPEEDFKKIKAEDKLNFEAQAWKAQKNVEELIGLMIEKGYTSAATYLENAKNNMFSYVKLWLKSGLVNPKVNSMIERMMREIGRRIKKIGFGWGPEGAEKMTRIIIKRITSANQWEKYWKERLNVSGKVKLTFLGCECL